MDQKPDNRSVQTIGQPVGIDRNTTNIAGQVAGAARQMTGKTDRTHSWETTDKHPESGRNAQKRPKWPDSSGRGRTETNAESRRSDERRPDEHVQKEEGLDRIKQMLRRISV